MTKTPAPRALYSVNEVAELLGISTKTVRRRVADGVIPSVLLGSRRLIPASYIRAISATPETTTRETEAS